jgi:hypothetical protein
MGVHVQRMRMVVQIRPRNQAEALPKLRKGGEAMSYHVENPRFKELPKQLIVHEDGYMDAYKREGEPIVDYVYILGGGECVITPIAPGSDMGRCSACGEIADTASNYCWKCGAKAVKR